MANKVMKITAADFERVVSDVVNQRMQIAQHASPYIPQERPREGVGGTNEHPFDDFGNDRNPPVINPATGKPEWAGTNQGMTIAGNPSFDINETPATRRTRKIRTLQERGVGGEAGNASDILKKGIQLPNLQANINESLQRENVGGTLRDMMLPLLIKEYGKDGSGGYKNPSKLLSGMKKLAQGGRGHTTVGDKLYLDPIKQKLMPLPIDLESDKDKEIRHNQRFKV